MAMWGHAPRITIHRARARSGARFFELSRFKGIPPHVGFFATTLLPILAKQPLVGGPHTPAEVSLKLGEDLIHAADRLDNQSAKLRRAE